MHTRLAQNLMSKKTADSDLLSIESKNYSLKMIFLYPGNIWNFRDGSAQFVQQSVVGAARVIFLSAADHELGLAVDAHRLHACII
jgi:hypothetical protein